MRGVAPMFTSRQPPTDALPPPGRPFFTWHGITFSAGTHLWSDPILRGTNAEAAIVMTAPTLFDLVELARRRPVDELRQINDALYAVDEIAALQYERTCEVLGKIAAVQRQLATQGPSDSRAENSKKSAP
ncbi:hypothetical protein [Cupriavidus campinensis]|uniref:hypothetical protein n=1 Tax=Cupriavidus campinensis TaxID=151783 RepID=UPI001BA731A3|nr:hypothetical protein [Cupriavidus campinensis]